MLRLLLNFAKHRALPAEVFARAKDCGDVPMVPQELRLRSGKAGGGPSVTPEPVRTSEAIARSHKEAK